MKKPFVIGVAGGSGSGKTTIAKNILRSLDPDVAVIISHDDYYRDQSHLSMDERRKMNYDHPSSLETTLLVTQLKQLVLHKTIQKPTYDFVRYTRAQATEAIKPTKVIILEGILLFESKDLRDLMDLKLFVDTDADVRLVRRIQRDMEERDRTLAFSSSQYMTFTRPMHYEFVEPSKRYADVIIPEGGENRVALDLVLARIHEVARK